MVRVLASLSALCLVAAAAVLGLNAGRYPHPLHQLPAIGLTFLAALLLLLVAARAFVLRRRSAGALTVAALVLAAGVPLLRYAPAVYHFTYERDLESLFPPFWPFSVAVALLLVLLLELALPVARPPRPQGAALAPTVAAAAAFLFLATVLLSTLVEDPAYFAVPRRVLTTHLGALGVTAVIALAAVLPRKGLVWEGAGLSLLTGLGIQVWALSFWGGLPRDLGTVGRVPDVVWALGVATGTVCGGLLMLAAVALWGAEYLARPAPAGGRAPTEAPAAAVDATPPGRRGRGLAQPPRPAGRRRRPRVVGAVPARGSGAARAIGVAGRLARAQAPEGRPGR